MSRSMLYSTKPLNHLNILYITNHSRSKSLAVFVDQSVTAKLFHYNNLYNRLWLYNTTVNREYFLVWFNLHTAIHFHLEGFVIGASLSETHHRRSTVKSVFLLASLLASSLIWMIAVYISTNLNTLMVH